MGVEPPRRTCAPETAPTLRRWRRLTTAVAAVAAVAGWCACSGSHGSVENERPGAEARRLAREVADLESQYERLRAADRGGREAIEVLDRARLRQRRRLALEPAAAVEESLRLDRLERARATEQARLAEESVAELEQAAAAEREAGRTEPALEKLRAALALQREVDDSPADSREKNFIRERSLAQQVAMGEAEPLAQAVEESIRVARAAVAGARWVEARAALARARAGQERMNRDYAVTRFASRPRLDELAAELTSLEGADLAAAIDAQEKAAAVAAVAGRAEEAAEGYRAAASLQRSLNVKLARSRFASTTRLEALEARRQEVRAGALLARAVAAERDATTALRRRQVFTAERKVAEAAELIERIEREYPKAGGIDASFQLKLAYLQRRRAQLRNLQDAVYDRVVPLAMDDHRLMLTTKVPQELYVKVMTANPSRRAGLAEPVDSASWEEAQEFCRRLSWVMGAPVRLPGEDEFRAALAEEYSTENVAGFRDLAGGLSEWLGGAGTKETMAPVAGAAAFGTSSRADGSVRLAMRAKYERARDVGFRIVLELPRE